MDNLKTIINNIDTILNPSGGPNSVKVVDHNGLLKSVINSVGKLAGFIFSAKRTGDATTGTFLWNGNAMNSTSTFNIVLSQLSADNQDLTNILTKLAVNDLIKFKDFSGRVALLSFQSFTEGVDGGGNDILTVSVQGFTSNTNYTYVVEDLSICAIEFITSGGKSVFDINSPLIHKDPSNGSPTNGPQKQDLVVVRVSQTKSITGIYKGNSLPLNLETSYIVIDETELPIAP